MADLSGAASSCGDSSGDRGDGHHGSISYKTEYGTWDQCESVFQRYPGLAQFPAILDTVLRKNYMWKPRTFLFRFYAADESRRGAVAACNKNRQSESNRRDLKNGIREKQRNNFYRLIAAR